MRSSNWCKNLAEISASSWKVSSSPWARGARVTSGSLCALGGIHLQHPQAEQGMLSPVLSLASLFLLHVLTNMNCNAEGRKGKDLKSQWKTVTKFHLTGNDSIWVDQFYLVSALCVSTRKAKQTQNGDRNICIKTQTELSHTDVFKIIL